MNARSAIFKFAIITLSGALAWAISSSPANFIDITNRIGLDFRLENSPTPEKFLPETMGGGVALLDYDNDGRLDVFFVNGARLSPSMTAKDVPDKSDPKYWNRLFHQNKDGTFSEVAEPAGLTGKTQGRYGMGVATGDYDNDGWEDIFVTGVGSNTLYRNNGNGTFTDVTERSGVGGSGWNTSAGFFDYDNDGKLDLFICRYVEWSFGDRRYCGDRTPGGRAYCHPDNFRGVANLLFHNNGDGTFTDVSTKAGIANPEGKSLGVAFADFDGDGWTDIYVANDSVPCFLYHNNRNGTFTDVAPEAGVGFNEDGQTFAGMGTDFADYDNDGKPDLVVTDLSNQRYVIFHNNGQGVFTDLTTQSGVGSATAAYSGWSTRFLDFDNDGWKDLFFAQGHVMDNIEVTTPNIRYLQPPLILHNTAGHFALVDGGPGLKKSLAGRGAAFGDLDNDGRLDIVATNLGEKAYVLHNESENTNGWIRLELTGKKSNRDGIGCRVKITAGPNLTQSYTVNTAAGYLSASDKRLTIGLGPSRTAKSIELLWPSGVRQSFTDVRSGTTVRAIEPSVQ
ncbi:MAG: CRTAC1 family protein [Bryobacteraceae bacterium]